MKEREEKEIVHERMGEMSENLFVYERPEIINQQTKAGSRFSVLSSQFSVLTLIYVVMSLLVAAAFGWAVWWLQESVQAETVNSFYGCYDGNSCERCAIVLFDRAQILYALSAGVSLFVLSFMNLRGWRGVLKIILVCFLCFQIYSAPTAWSVMHRQECTALYVPRSIPIFSIIAGSIGLFVRAMVGAVICSAVLIVCNTILLAVSAKPDDFTGLDLQAK